MDAPSTSEMASVRVKAAVGDYELAATMTVPAGPTRLDDLLPLLQIMSDNIVAGAEETGRQQGLAVSCRKGCGACCRQPVPISPVEARDIARLVSQLPQPWQLEIRRRFAQARQRLEEAGLWEKLERRQSWLKNEVTEIAMEYFRLGIACPFLEDECCSIHPQRPLACREYLVTSPAANCSQPTRETVKGLPLPAKVWVAAARCEPPPAGAKYLHWVPLIQALDWADAHPPPPAEKTGPALIRQVLEGLANSSLANLSQGAEPCDPRPAGEASRP